MLALVVIAALAASPDKPCVAPTPHTQGKPVVNTIRTRAVAKKYARCMKAKGGK